MADESLVISSGWYEAVDIPRGWRLVFSFDGRALEAKVLPGANFGWRLFVGNKPIRVAGGSRLDFDSPEQARAQGLRALGGNRAAVGGRLSKTGRTRAHSGVLRGRVGRCYH